MSYLDIVSMQLRIDEGCRTKPYRCTAGKLTIGVGRNLDDVGLRPDEIVYLLENDIRASESDAKIVFPCFDQLSDARKAVLVNMAFNLGRSGISKFKKFCAALEAGDYELAAGEMMASAWAVQVGPRAFRLSNNMRRG